MTIEDLIIWLVIGGVAGWLAGLVVKGYGLGLIGNIAVGICRRDHCRLAVAAHRICSSGRHPCENLKRRHRGRDSLACDRSLSSATLKLATV